jgi:hypothetical protein
MGATVAALTHTQSDSGAAPGGLEDDGCCEAGFSGGAVPVESQPDWLQTLTFLFPSRHYVSFSQAILYRGAGVCPRRQPWPGLLHCQPRPVSALDGQEYMNGGLYHADPSHLGANRFLSTFQTGHRLCVRAGLDIRGDAHTAPCHRGAAALYRISTARRDEKGP